MKADEGGLSAAERNREHMAQVRAIHRRSAYERVSRKIECFEELRRAAGGVLPVSPPTGAEPS